LAGISKLLEGSLLFPDRRDQILLLALRKLVEKFEVIRKIGV
jgi:hypothetical protein